MKVRLQSAYRRRVPDADTNKQSQQIRSSLLARRRLSSPIPPTLKVSPAGTKCKKHSVLVERDRSKLGFRSVRPSLIRIVLRIRSAVPVLQSLGAREESCLVSCRGPRLL